MNRLLVSLALSSLLSLAMGASTVAKKLSEARVGFAAGELAVWTKTSPQWQILPQGDSLPEECDIRTGVLRPCVIQLAPGTLHAAASTSLQLRAKGRSISVHCGRVLLQTGDVPWTVRVGKSQTIVHKESAAEFDVGRGGLLSIAVTKGATGSKSVELFAGQMTTGDANGELFPRSLSEEVKQRIAAWSAPIRVSQGLGQLVIKDVQSGSPVRLNVARYHVNVVLKPPVALVQIDQSFYNPLNRQEEGTFIFNLPRGASVSRFAMYVTPKKLVEGELIERQRASNVYETIVRRRRDPAILEQIGDNLFRMRVFPVFARDTKRILLDYTIPLDDAKGTCRFRLPLLSDLKPIWDFRLSGTILGSTASAAAATGSRPMRCPGRRCPKTG